MAESPLPNLPPKELALLETFVSKLKRRELVGPTQAALETALIVRNLISSSKWSSASSLISLLSHLGSIFTAAQPSGISVGNIIRRVLRLIRDEHKGITSELPLSLHDNLDDKHPMLEMMMMADKSLTALDLFCHSHVGDSSMFNLLANPNQKHSENVAADRSKYELKPILFQGMNELIDEVENSIKQIEVHSFDHIDNGDVILTIGNSRTVNQFLISASKKKKLQVIISETMRLRGTDTVSSELLKTGIDVVLIKLSSIGTVISKVTKVIIGCHAILANGGLLAIPGSQLLATCAFYHSIPVVVISGIYKLSPLFPSDIDLLSCPGNPSLLSKYQDDILCNITTIAPFFDYVEPSMVSLYLTNVGGHTPTYIYRLLGELYDPQDTQFS